MIFLKMKTFFTIFPLFIDFALNSSIWRVDLKNWITGRKCGVFGQCL